MSQPDNADLLIGAKTVRPAAAIGIVLRARLRADLDAARLAAADLGRAAAVHDFRKATKRLRPRLRLIEPSVGRPARRLRAELGDLAGRLGKARDAAAARLALDDLIAARLVGKAAATEMRRRLADAERAAAAAAADAPLGPRLQRAVEDAVAEIDRWLVEGIAFDDVARALARTYRAARRAVPSDWGAASVEALHRLRRRTVEHRYQMSLLKPSWPKLGTAHRHEAEALRDALGAHHDLAGLAALTAGDGALAAWQAELTTVIAQRQAEHLAAARVHAARLFAERPKAFRRRIVALWQAAHADA